MTATSHLASLILLEMLPHLNNSQLSRLKVVLGKHLSNLSCDSSTHTTDERDYVEAFLTAKKIAPETEQPYGPQATEALRKLILGKKIEGEAVTRDIYGRIVCRVVCDKRDMSLTMIRQGYAWPYYQYFYRLSPKERAAYKRAALLAKTEGLGLWQEKNPTAPWQWRKDHRTVFTRLMYWLRRFVWWILRR